MSPWFGLSQLRAHSQAVGDSLPLTGWLSWLHNPSTGTGWVNYGLRGIYKLTEEESKGQELTHLVKISLGQPWAI